jgi:hypothetical protein
MEQHCIVRRNVWKAPHEIEKGFQFGPCAIRERPSYEIVERLTPVILKRRRDLLLHYGWNVA